MSSYLKQREREKRLEKIRGKARNGNGGAKERHARRRLEAGESVSVLEVDEWRGELLEASDAGETAWLGFNHKVQLAPVIADLDPEYRRWFRGLLEQTQDTSEDYLERLPYREQQSMFRALDEQINSATPAQILEYKRKALEA